MLIVSRRIDESIQIGDNITVTILEIKGKQVRIGISAPDDVAVHREEIIERIRTGQNSVDQQEPAQQHATGNRRKILGLSNSKSR